MFRERSRCEKVLLHWLGVNSKNPHCGRKPP
nr:MAG TPA: hypothetical protein [Caudoviricetes sp.]